MRNLALIGFMGSGKTTVGRRLAEELGLIFVDTDDLVEQKAGRRIVEIFELQGEACFRALESQVVKEIVQGDGKVIACGGGVTLRERNVEVLKENAWIIYLQTSVSALYERLEGETAERPLLQTADPEAQMRQLLAEREDVYRKVADIVVDTDAQDVDSVVSSIIEKLKEREFGR